MIDIIPAVLEHSVDDLRVALERLRGASATVQIDMVGSDFLKNEESLPLWDEFDFEFDLMLPHPEQHVEHCIELGASRIIVHARDKGAHEALLLLQHLRGGSFATEVGIALAVDETPRALDAFEGLYDYVQVMGIAHEGSQGQTFDERALALVQHIHALHPAYIIQVDGGLRTRHVRALVDVGASRLVAGSAILNADNPRAAYEALVKEANQ
ncbi:MAG TPA: hypothetical protein VG984_00435 [Candidatus Paceibacterota bacterium]|nr:hypothetical protein [Candidatus Paceibacterota bacterium]